jgi:hypothetical protein
VVPRELLASSAVGRMRTAEVTGMNTVNVELLEVPPPGAGVDTVT